MVGGAVVATGAVLGGTVAGLAGGFGGAWMNLKDGGSEVYQSSKNRFSSSQPQALPASSGGNQGELLFLEDTQQQRKSTAELGKKLWQAGISSS